MIELLRKERRYRGLSQSELANRLKKPQAFVSHVERGARRIDVIEFCVIARALGQDPVALFANIVSQLPSTVEI